MTVKQRRNARMLAMLLLAVGCSMAFAADKPTTKKSPAPSPVKSHAVRISDKKYVPDSLKVKVGETVVWQNDDDHDHTVIADDKSFKSGNINPDDSFEYKFAKAGTFKYSCKYHPRMKGTITVEK